MPGPAYLIFASVENYADFDREASEHEATLKGATPAEKELFDKGFDMLGSEENHRFEVDPLQSYVPKALPPVVELSVAASEADRPSSRLQRRICAASSSGIPKDRRNS